MCILDSCVCFLIAERLVWGRASLSAASSPDEFARLPQLLQLHQMRAMTMHLFTTKRHGTPAAVTEALQQQQQSQSSQGVADLVIQTGRIQQEHFQAALQQLQAGQAGQVSAYVCGPPVMTDQVGGLVVLPALSRQEATNQQQKQHLQASGMRVSVQLAVGACFLCPRRPALRCQDAAARCRAAD